MAIKVISGAPTPIFRFNIGGQPAQNISQPSMKPGQPFIMNLRTGDKLFFQTVPEDMNYDPDSQFMPLQSPGRNNPLYNYTGSEDTLTFTLSWYGNDSTYETVLRSCKWLESLTKNDSYDNPPPNVLCVFGNMFKDAKWLVTKAPYKLHLLSRPNGMLPQLAYQDLTLKRVTETNRTTQDILKLTT
jgi:hypothetical protein